MTNSKPSRIVLILENFKMKETIAKVSLENS